MTGVTMNPAGIVEIRFWQNVRNALIPAAFQNFLDIAFNSFLSFAFRAFARCVFYSVFNFMSFCIVKAVQRTYQVRTVPAPFSAGLTIP